ncbi:MAG: hypothetical protein SVN78_08610 [Deferribacterota bacterium]|nr:hypothetical protein [Deferribacterota bacterium]
MIRIYIMFVSCKTLIELNDQKLRFNDKAISKRINESPTRFERAVNIPPAKAVGD